MSDLLALEWDHDQISAVSAHVAPGRVHIRRCFVMARPAAAVAGSGPLPIDWLKSQLAGQGITAGDVLVTLPRDEAVVKRIELPEMADEDLPVLVRFQAGAKSSVPLEELSLDFIPLPRRNEIPGREALMATVPRQTILEIQTLCETAGLELRTLGLTPAALAELVVRAEPEAGDDLTGASLVVSRHGSRLEISVFRRCHLLFAHSARLAADETLSDPQSIVSEVSRSLVALRGAIPDVRIERAWTLLDAAAHEPLSEVLRKRLSCDVQPLDPFAFVEFDRTETASGLEPALFSGPIGLLLARAEPRVPTIDFLAPRQPAVKRDSRKRRIVVLSAAAGILVALLLGNYWITLGDLDGEIAQLEQTDRDLAALLKRGQPTMKSLALIDKWDEGTVTWLDQMADLTRNLPSTDRIYLKKLELAPKSPSLPARIKPDGFAREQKDVTGLSDLLLAADERYRVLPPNHRETNDDQNYPWKFEADILLVEVPKKKEKEARPGSAGASSKPAAASGSSRTDAEGKRPAASGSVQSAAEGSAVK
jgi:Tfp pilus assembly PilM family ATPase